MMGECQILEDACEGQKTSCKGQVSPPCGSSVLMANTYTHEKSHMPNNIISFTIDLVVTKVIT